MYRTEETSTREGQNDQCGGGRIDEHEHGDGILDDRTQAHVGDGEGEQREQNRPELIGNFPVRHLDERFRAYSFGDSLHVVECIATCLHKIIESPSSISVSQTVVYSFVPY